MKGVNDPQILLNSADKIEAYISRRTAEGNVDEQDHINVVGAFRAVCDELFTLASKPGYVETYNDWVMRGNAMRDRADAWLTAAVLQFQIHNPTLAVEAGYCDYRFRNACSTGGSFGHERRVQAGAFQLMHLLEMHTAWDLLPQIHITGQTKDVLQEAALKSENVPLQLSGEAIDYLNLSASKHTFGPRTEETWQYAAHEMHRQFLAPLGGRGIGAVGARSVSRFVGVNA